MTPEDRKEMWDKKFSEGDDFYELINHRAEERTFEASGCTRPEICEVMACFTNDEIVEMFNTRSSNPAALQAVVKRQLGFAGKLTRRGTKVIHETGEICILLDRIEDAPGKTRADRVIYAKAESQGINKIDGLFQLLSNHYDVTVTEDEVRKWYNKRRGK